MAKLSVIIIGQAKKESPFNAIVIYFYDYEEYFGYGYTLGKVTYAPYGDWVRASDVKTGDYSLMDYKYELVTKDWSKQLTKEEAMIFKEWQDLYIEKSSVNDIPDESDITKAISEKYGITSEDVEQILMKQLIWLNQ